MFCGNIRMYNILYVWMIDETSTPSIFISPILVQIFIIFGRHLAIITTVSILFSRPIYYNNILLCHYVYFVPGYIIFVSIGLTNNCYKYNFTYFEQFIWIIYVMCHNVVDIPINNII